MKIPLLAAVLALSSLAVPVLAKDAPALKVGDAAPAFTAVADDGKDFALESRKGSWTVLYFYPKSGTPGCTKQACAFRDGIDAIRKTGAEVYGVSKDTLERQRAFKAEHRLPFALIADPDGKVIALYGTKKNLVGLSKRWTFLIDPELKIRWIEKDVDPALDAQRVNDELKRLMAAK